MLVLLIVEKLEHFLKKNMTVSTLFVLATIFTIFVNIWEKNLIKTNDLISFLKKILLKNKKNQELWKIYTDIPLPNWPIITRWGTWVSCAIYISNNRNNIKKILNSLEKSYYNEIKKYVNCSELNFELD